ncbi:Non-heme chloroperoxidase [Labilithrix luteola]|uniref:Non-heme chloroperoxidase n=1 Tax=Labilithrix luteola TaxID=1391654 RepID=A0A0K1PK53_9BACT|nr:alpha/beta hydrolase [Labilithrix luteola]AKU93897.1 Non-heme chloroperoxidase [Labilithrix luteola]
MPFFEANDGTRLFYRDWGRENRTKRPILFLSSWSLSSVMWQYQMVELERQGHRCIALDRRGHGRSDEPDDGYDFDTLADDVARLVEKLDLRDLVIVGHSMGSGEAVRYFGRHGRGRVAGLALVGTILPFLRKTDDNPEGVDVQFFEATRARWREDFTRWMDDSTDAYVGKGLPGSAISEGLVEWTKADMLSTSVRTLIACNMAVSDTDFREEMRAIDVPTIFIHGTHDASISLALGPKRAAQLVPNSRLEVYENAPHGLYMTHRERLNRDLLAFVAECGGKVR